MGNTEIGKLHGSVMPQVPHAPVHLAAAIGTEEVPARIIRRLNVAAIRSEFRWEDDAYTQANFGAQSLQSVQERVSPSARLGAGKRSHAPQLCVHLALWGQQK